MFWSAIQVPPWWATASTGPSVRSTGPQWLPPSVVPSTVPGQCGGGVPASCGTGHAGPCKLASPTLGPSKAISCSCCGPDHTFRQTRPPSSVRNSSPGATVRAQRAAAMRGGQLTVGATLSQACCAPAATSPSAAPGPAHWRCQVFPPSSVPSTSTALVGCSSKLAVTANQPVLAPTKASCDAESSAPAEAIAATAALTDAVAWGVLACPQEANAAARATVPRPAKARAARGLSPSCVRRVTPTQPNGAARGFPDWPRRVPERGAGCAVPHATVSAAQAQWATSNGRASDRCPAMIPSREAAQPFRPIGCVRPGSGGMRGARGPSGAGWGGRAGHRRGPHRRL